MRIAIIDYGSGNTQSVKYALKRLGCESVLTSDKEVISSSDKVIFPGVGQASSAMSKLKFKGLDELIPNLKQPVLGICLGMQLMCDFSEEGNTDCLKIFDSNVKRFKSTLKVPQIGWNTVFGLKTSLFDSINENEYMYLVHSYYVPLLATTVATSNYGINYSTAIKKNNFIGVQFHPEKSGSQGEVVLKNFINN
jgi:glutamine amidotransferase|tara:strand:+ start:3646 stop:4227 length:582 start_codon:yes stop_codon:yes gene_type:complete